MELTSGYLSLDEYVRGVARTIEFLRDVGTRELMVAYGFDCNVPSDQKYEYLPVSIDDLSTFIAEAQTAERYRLGANDLLIKDATGRFDYLAKFCHESDIHLYTDDRQLVEQLKAGWRTEGFRKMWFRLAEGQECEAVE